MIEAWPRLGAPRRQKKPDVIVSAQCYRYDAGLFGRDSIDNAREYRCAGNPMFASGEIDWESLEALVEWHATSGTAELFLSERRESRRRLVLKRIARLFVLLSRRRKVE